MKQSPNIRFKDDSGKDFPNWRSYKYSELFSFGKSNSFSRDKLTYESGKVFNIHYGDIHSKFRTQFDIENEHVPTLNINMTPKLDELVEVGDIIMADASEDYADIGKTIEIVNTSNKQVISGLHTVLGKPNRLLLSLGFAGQLFLSEAVKLKIKRVAQGVKVLGLPKKYLEKVELKVPKPDEQQKIADFLGSVDEWIENLEKQKDAIETYKKGMMQKIFSQRIRFKDKNGKDFQEWRLMTIEEIGEIYSGLTGKKADDFGSGEPFITYKQIFDKSEIDVNNFAYVKIDKHENQNRAQYGDVFFTTSSETANEVGYSSVLLNSNVSPFLNSFSFALRPHNTDHLLPEFAKFLFRSPQYRKEMYRLAQGSTRYNVSKKYFVKLKLLVPFKYEQQKIADFLTSIDVLIQSKQSQITKAKQWKKGLLQQMFV